MKRVRVTVMHNPDDPAEDLRYAAKVRRDLWGHSPAEVDPDNPDHGTHRDANRNAYFEFTTDYLDEVQRLLAERNHAPRVSLTVVEEAGPECANCGYVAGPVLPAICPNCGFRDIGACPRCGKPVPRQLYSRVGGDLFLCPECQGRVRLRFHDPLLDACGHYNQPLVVAEPAAE
jgi:DNA-directed RNA polymerase subunit RPC12/RpoP